MSLSVRGALAVQMPKKQPIQDRAKATVGAIMEAAVQVLARHGPLKTTTHRIAKRAGVSVGTLYQYFPNKQSVFSELLRQYREKSLERLVQSAFGTAHLPIDEVIDRATDSFLQPFFEHPEGSRALMQNRDAFVTREERVAMMDKVQGFLAMALQARDDIPPVPDVEMFAFTLVRTAEALCTAAVTDRPDALMDGSLKRELNHLLVSYVTSPRSSRR